MSKNKVLGILTVALAVIVFIATYRLQLSMQLAAGDPGPWLFPGIAGGLLFVFGLMVMFDNKQKDEQFLSGKEWKRAILLFAIFVGYAAAIIVVGFLISSIAMLFVCCTLFAGEKMPPLIVRILYAVILGSGIWYVLGEVFKVTLPSGMLFG
ncbi:MAG: tripartite tricarboxylate transporter TctB family protein [Lachnospiraceae bacterium]|nr:tripartite tricarboxylate transporter TctB family protein [Lachnospiraceae bacterium]